MTPEDVELLRSLSAPLVESPLPWSELSPEQQSAFRLLMPSPFFAPEQRGWIDLWWLPVTEGVIVDLNALCPANTLLSGRVDLEGNFFVSVDLLSDALDGGRLAALLPMLEALPLTYKAPEDWTMEEEN